MFVYFVRLGFMVFMYGLGSMWIGLDWISWFLFTCCLTKLFYSICCVVCLVKIGTRMFIFADIGFCAVFFLYV